MRTHRRYTFLIQSVVAVLLIFGNVGSFSVSSGVREITRTEWVSVHKEKYAVQPDEVKENFFQITGKPCFEYRLSQLVNRTHQQLLIHHTTFSYFHWFLFHTHSLCPEGNQLIIA